MSSGGSSWQLNLVLSINEAKALIDELGQYAREQLKVPVTAQTPGQPGATAPGTGVSTFGGQTGQNDPSAWRSRDPAAGRVREPTVMGQRLSTLPPQVQQAIAAADPVSAQWLAQQAAPRMTPSEIRRAEQLHQWGVRNLEYERRQERRAENEQWRNESYVDRRDFRDELSSRRERVRGENRQNRDETFVERQRIAEEKADRRQRTADENRQHRDESFVDRRDFSDDRRRRRERVTAENRQERDESYVDRQGLALERSAFRADMSGQSPRARAALLDARMAGMSPESPEYHQLRAQRAALNNQLGMNATLIPNHMYMNMMFGAFDIMGQVSHLAKARSQAMVAGTAIESLTAQAQGVTGGGGIISTILKGAWDAAGMAIPGLDSPAKLEETAMKEARRRELQYRVSDINTENKISQLARSAPAGTFAARLAENEAAQVTTYEKNQRRINEITEKWKMGGPNDPLVTAAEQNELKALEQSQKENDATRLFKDYVVGREIEAFKRRSATASDISLAVVGGASSTTAARMRLQGEHLTELEKAAGDKPEVIDAIKRRQSTDMLEFNYQAGQRDAATQALQRAGISSTVFQGLRRPYEAEIASIIGQGQAGMAQGDGPMGKFMAMGQMLASLSNVGGAFIRNTSNLNLSNLAETTALNQLYGGDPVSAIRTRSAERLRVELDNLPQGPFRALTESGVRKRIEAEEALQVKGVQDQRFVEKEAASSRAIVAGEMGRGQDKTAAIDSIFLRGADLAKSYQLQNRPEMERLSLLETKGSLESLKRQMQIAQYTNSSVEEISTGTYGQGGSSSMPRELEEQPLEEGLKTIDERLQATNDLLKLIVGDD